MIEREKSQEINNSIEAKNGFFETKILNVYSTE